MIRIFTAADGESVFHVCFHYLVCPTSFLLLHHLLFLPLPEWWLLAPWVWASSAAPVPLPTPCTHDTQAAPHWERECHNGLPYNTYTVGNSLASQPTYTTLPHSQAPPSFLSILQATESWAGPGNKADPSLFCGSVSCTWWGLTCVAGLV